MLGYGLLFCLLVFCLASIFKKGTREMNANELADELEQSALATHRSLEVATMLRQQQAEIEALKADNEQMCKALFKATRAILRKAQEK